MKNIRKILALDGKDLHGKERYLRILIYILIPVVHTCAIIYLERRWKSLYFGIFMAVYFPILFVLFLYFNRRAQEA